MLQQTSALDTTGRPGDLFKEVGRRTARRVLPLAVGLFALQVAIGLLITHPLADLVAGEVAVNQALEANRSPFWDTVTMVASRIGNTEYIIAAAAVLLIVLRLVFNRWRESVVVVAAAILQLAVFDLTTLVINRPRPDVPQLDEAPPTSSFPSGHVSAAAAVYVGLAVVLAWHIRRTTARVLLIVALSLIPLAVAIARLYRGMHFLTDVTVGLLCGLACLAIVVYAFLADDPQRHTDRSRADLATTRTSAKSGLGSRSHNPLGSP